MAGSGATNTNFQSLPQISDSQGFITSALQNLNYLTPNPEILNKLLQPTEYVEEVGQYLLTAMYPLYDMQNQIVNIINQVSQNYDVDIGAYQKGDKVVRISDLTKLGLDTGILLQSDRAGSSYSSGKSTQAPAAPTDITIVDPGGTYPANVGPADVQGQTNNTGMVSIVWNDPSDLNLNGVEVWRSESDDTTTAQHIETIAVGKEIFVERIQNIPVPGTTYYYWLRSIDNSLNRSRFASTDSVGDSAAGDSWTFDIQATINEAMDALWNNTDYVSTYKVISDSFQVIQPSTRISSYNALTTYSIYDKVLYSGHYYQSLQNSNTGHTPATNPTWWENIDSAIDTASPVFIIGSIGGTATVGINGDLFVDGSIVADAIATGTLTASVTTSGNIIVSTGGAIYSSGKTSFSDTTAGFWMGDAGSSTYKLNIGDNSYSLQWDGAALTVNGSIIDRTNILAGAVTDFVGSWTAASTSISGSFTEVQSLTFDHTDGVDDDIDLWTYFGGYITGTLSSSSTFDLDFGYWTGTACATTYTALLTRSETSYWISANQAYVKPFYTSTAGRHCGASNQYIVQALRVKQTNITSAQFGGRYIFALGAYR